MNTGSETTWVRAARRSGDLLLVAAASSLAALVILADGPAWVRITLGLPFALLLPGYALAALLFPRRGAALGEEEDGLRPGERLALSLGFSVSVVPLLGLALNLTPLGLRVATVAPAILLTTLAAAAVAAARRARLPGEEAAAPPLLAGFGSVRRGEKIVAGVLILAILAVGTGLIVLASAPDPVDPTTEFYLTGTNGKVGLYPTQLLTGRTGALLVGAENHEGRAYSYEVRPRAEHHPNGTDSPLPPIHHPTLAFTLADAERWESPFNFSLPRAGTWRVSFDLHREGHEGAYRSLHLWVRVKD